MKDDLTGWVPITCDEADELHDRKSLRIAAGFTDVLGEHGDLLSYREWTHLDSPVLREFRYRPPLGCSHHVPTNRPPETDEENADG